MVSVIVGIIADFFVIIGGLIAIIQLWLYRIDKKNEMKRHKRESTIMYLGEVMPRLSQMDTEIIGVFSTGESIETSDERLTNEMKSSIRDFLKVMERLSVGLNMEVFDIEVVRRLIGTGIITTWNRLEKIIQKKRIDLNNPKLYIEFEQVVKKLK